MARTVSVEEFEDLYRAVAPAVFGYVRKRTGGDAEAIVADTFVVAWRRRGEMPAEEHRRAWLFGVARNLLLVETRLAEREARLQRDLSAAPEVGMAGPLDGAADARASATRAALARLPEAQREVLQLTAWEGLGSADLAVALGVRPGAARVRLHRARAALAADPELARLVDRDESATELHRSTSR